MPEPSSTYERLPSSVIPKHYDLWLKPDLKKLDYDGNVVVQVEVKEVTSNIVLNATSLSILTAEFKDALGKKQTAIKTELIATFETCMISFGEALALGHGELHIQFHGDLDESMKGFYRTKYTTPEGEDRYAAVTQFEPIDARKAFPCWDEPALKATFGVTLVVPKDRIGISNMNVISERPYGPNDEHREIKFANTPIMSSYLLAVVVGEFDYVETNLLDGVNIKVYTPLGKKEQGNFALDVAAKALPFFKEYFDIAYPLPKMDLIAVPDFANGAMENWGLVLYRESCLLVDSLNTAQESKQRVALTVCHELAHQWFGNIVTMEWWTNLWLNEGFASFMEYLTVDHLFPEYLIWSNYMSATYSEAMRLDALTNSHPIEVPIGHPSEIDEIFDEISYYKGSSVIRMLHKFIGDEAFRKGMHMYLSKHAYKNTTTEDLWDALEKASSKPVSAVMNTWTKQKGFPVITVSLKQDGTNQILTLSQEKFVADGLVDDKKYLWIVPISLSDSKNPGETVKQILLDSKTTEVVFESRDWIKLNPGMIGFYRVQYSKEILSRFLPAVASKQLPLLDRLGLQNDLFALVKAGRASSVEVLKLMEAYTTETDYVVWNSLSSCLAALNVLLSHTDFDSLFDTYCCHFYSKIYAKIGWEPINGESSLDKLLRSLVISRLASAKDQGVLTEGLKRFEAHVNGTTIIPADLRRSVYKAAIIGGDDKTVESMIKLYKEVELHEEKNRLALALGSVETDANIRKVLEFSLSSNVRSQDLLYFVVSVARSKAGRDLSWRFFQEKKDEFRARYKGGTIITRVVQAVTEDFASEDKALEIESFFAKNPFPGIDRMLLQSLETIRLNVKWLARDQQAIKNYLSSRS